MDFYNGSGSPKFISLRLDKEMDVQPLQEQTEQMGINPALTTQVPELGAAPEVRNPGSVIEITSTNDDTESCGAYFTREMEALRTEHFGQPASVNPADEEKASECEPMVVTPCLNYADLPDDTSEELPEVTFFTNPNSSLLSASTSVQQGANERKVLLLLTLRCSVKSQFLQ